MIETKDAWSMAKAIVPVDPNNLEKIVASPSIVEKLNFTSMIFHQDFASVSIKDQFKKVINHFRPKSLPRLC